MPTAVEYINAMRDQRNISFNMIQKFFTNNKLKSAVSLDLLLRYYSDITTDNAIHLKDIEEAAVVLERIYNDNLCYGNRIIFLYRIDDTQVDNLANLLKLFVANDAQKPEVLLFQNSYPFNIDSNQLNSIDIGSKFFIKEIDDNNFIRIISCTPRLFKKRDTIDPNLLGNNYLEYDEIYAYKKGVNQAFDSIVLHRDKAIVEIQIDASHPVSKDDLDITRYGYLDLLKRNYESNYQDSRLDIKPKNIFANIVDLYNENLGNVVELGHQTFTGSIKNEKMNSKDKNLKIEDFHQGGLTAVNGQIGIFAITKKYDSPELHKKNKIELSINGGVKLIKADNPIINYVEFNNCVYRSDYEYLINKLI